MRSEDASWGYVAFLAVLAVVLVFMTTRCTAANKDDCKATGGTPLDQNRSVHVWCVYTDGRPPTEFEMR